MGICQNNEPFYYTDGRVVHPGNGGVIRQGGYNIRQHGLGEAHVRAGLYNINQGEIQRQNGLNLIANGSTVQGQQDVVNGQARIIQGQNEMRLG